MSFNLGGRLAKLESKLPVALRPRRVLRIVSGEGQDDAAGNLVEAEGLAHAAGDIVIHRVIVAAPGNPRLTFSPRFHIRSPEHVR